MTKFICNTTCFHEGCLYKAGEVINKGTDFSCVHFTLLDGPKKVIKEEKVEKEVAIEDKSNLEEAINKLSKKNKKS